MKPATLLKAFASASLIGLILWTIGPMTLVETLAAIEPGRGAAMAGLSLLFILARAWKWQVVAKADLPSLSYGRALASLVGGMGLGMVTPARAGEFSRALFLPEGDRVRLVGLFTVDRVIDLLTIVAFGALASTIVGYPLPGALAGAGVLAGVVVLFSAHSIFRRLLPLAERLRVGGIAHRLEGGLESLGGGRMTRALCASLVSTAVGYLHFHVILGGFVDLPIHVASFAFSAMILSNLLPVSIAGLGVREWVSVLLLRDYGVPDAVAVNAAFLSYLMNTVAPGILGALMFARVPVGPGEAKASSASEGGVAS